MPVMAIVVVSVLAAAAVAWIRRRRGRALREPDWWPEFERAFRSYVCERSGRHGPGRPGTAGDRSLRADERRR